MNQIVELLPLLIPIMIIQAALVIFAIVHIVKHQKFRFGNMVIWLIIVLFFSVIGPILYFTIGRKEE